jgi:hypothetical protein
MHSNLYIDDIDGTRPNKFKHSRRGYQIPVQNPFDGGKYLQRPPYGNNDFHQSGYSTNPSVIYTYGSPKGSNNFANWGQNIAYQDSNAKLQTTNDTRNPLYFNYAPQLQNSSSKLNLIPTGPQDSLDAFKRDQQSRINESIEEPSSKSYATEPSYLPRQEAKNQNPQNLGVSSPKNFNSNVKQTERISTEYEEPQQVKNAQYYGMQPSSPKRTGRTDNYEKSANKFFNPTFQTETSEKKPEREASPEDTVKMRNPMFADFNYAKYDADASMRRTRFVANKDDSLEMVQKGITGNYLNYPSQGSAIEKTYGDHYGLPQSPSVSKSFYDQTDAIKSQYRRNPINNSYQPIERPTNQASEQLKLIGSNQPKYQQSYFY